ncbi:uncharacterized protein TERG_05074 [Trichophyton rubrum CBS 118892]|uniref:Uncharacterized protein n=1 Tax=Trichophyton rubrum (strain ATCC MYA-4607 / CBS 118892) TaxID=559305 RepID=F2SR57_TRIRC|nr:uncharacterized protein TERG_05074 [Trichophyton rubrum CBS 118892]EGD88825.2 hypothetical protein TERG_05074 [Trichophyton rubrum CBS 118892]
MAHENHIDWRPLTQKVLEKWALASGPELPEPRHCTISSPSRLRESGPYAVAYFYLVTAAEPGPWYVIESALWDTEKNFKLREATFIVPCRDPPSASHPFVCEWDNGLHVYIVRHLKGAKNLTVVKEATKKNSKKKPRKSPKKKPQKMEDDYPSGMESYDGTSDEPEGSSRHTTNGQQDSIGDVLDTQPRASPHDGSPADEKPSDSEKMAASNEEESSSSSPESDACDEDTPASSQSHDNIGNSSSEKPMDTDDFDTDDFDTDEIDTEVPSFFKYSESDEEEDIQGYNAADYECCRQDTELSEEALDEIYSRDQAQDEKTAVKRGKKRPVLDSTDSDSYYVEPWLPFNGLLNPHWRCWSRKDFKNGMCERGVPKRIRIRPTPMSPLSQCVLASEI